MLVSGSVKCVSFPFIVLLVLLVCDCSFSYAAWSLFGLNLKIFDSQETVAPTSTAKEWGRSEIETNEVFTGANDEDDIDPNIIEDSFLKTPGLLEKYGYPVKIYHVKTLDGYILEIHRIPKDGAIPILLVHGLLDSSSTWVMMGPKKGFAYMLSDLGYDVWMANTRGNTYSRNHTYLDPHKGEYWQFSFHEMGKFDIPATLDFVLNATGKEKLHYVGHSQGSICFWVMCSEHPEYNKKIISMQALAPIAYLGKCKSPVVEFLAFFQEPIQYLLKLIGTNEFLPSNEFLTLFSQIICKDKTITQSICSNIIFLLTGFDKAEMNETMLPVIIGHVPAGASTKQLLHYAQLKKSGYFRQYDYGFVKNYIHYKRLSPPSYSLDSVTAKVALHYSQNDWLSSSVDVERLHVELPNVIGKFLVNYERFNHLDFVWGIDVREMLYKKVVKLMSLVERGEL